MMPTRVAQRLVGALLGLVVLACAQNLAKAAELAPNEVALLLAGLPPPTGSEASRVAQEASWQAHARAMDRYWSALESRQLSPIRTWAARNMTAPRSTVLYMFSGPDFLYVNAFLGHAETYVLAGLEPAGRIPRLTDATRLNPSAALGGLRGSLNALLSYSFFKTENMRHELRARTFEGTLPLLYVFLARAGKTVRAVTSVELDTEGRLLLADDRDGDSAKGPAAGVEIEFSGADNKIQRLYYFRTDLSDGAIGTSGFLPFVEKQGRVDSLIKSASYLLYSNGFSRARQLVLAQSDHIVQDDTGVPLTYFSPQDWELRPYGRYLGPINKFHGRYQGRLAELFRRPAGPLDFGIGYRWRRSESNLVLAVRKATAHAGTGTPVARQK